ncbi:hypothetical protein HanOQP8_Chr01g0027321 [Helianthus annuus]|nr:hypothetical protein HanOQP8_Chr01g0027321 [Helianthus annuus]
MYLRFTQMIINAQHPDLPKADTDILKIETMLDHSFNLFKGHSAKKYKESDPPRKMFGALLNKEYLAPANDKRRHGDSQSDNEEPKLEKMKKEKFKRKRDSFDSSNSDNDEEGGDGDGGDAGATSASAPGAGSVGGDEQADSEPDNQPDPGYEFFINEHGVKSVRKIRTEESEKDADYVPSDTEAEQLKRK